MLRPRRQPERKRPPKATRSRTESKDLTPMVDDPEKHIRHLRRQAAIFPFMRLPAELRIKIYELVMGYRRAEILLEAHDWNDNRHSTFYGKVNNAKLTYAVIACRDSVYLGSGEPLSTLGDQIRVYPLPPFCRICGKCQPVEGQRLDIAPLRICKTIYHEARNELYSKITIVVVSPILITAFLKKIGHHNAALIRRMRIYYSKVVCRYRSPIDYWINKPWEHKKALSCLTRLHNLTYLQFVNVVGAGNPSWRYSWEPFSLMGAIKQGLWTGGYVRLLANENEPDRLQELKEVFGTRRRIPGLRYLSGFADMDVSVNFDWLMMANGSSNRQEVIRVFGLDKKMLEDHIRAVKTGEWTDFRNV